MANLLNIIHVTCYILTLIVTGSCGQPIHSHNGSATFFFNHQNKLYIYAMNYSTFYTLYNCLSSNKTLSCHALYKNESNLYKVDEINQIPDAQGKSLTTGPFYTCTNNLAVNTFICERISYDRCSVKSVNTSTYFHLVLKDTNVCIGLYFNNKHECLSFSNVDDFQIYSTNQSEMLRKELDTYLQPSCLQSKSPLLTAVQQPSRDSQSTSPALTIAQEPNNERNITLLTIILGVTVPVLVLIAGTVVLFIWKRKRFKNIKKHSVIRTETSEDDMRRNSLCRDDNRSTHIDETRIHKNISLCAMDAVSGSRNTECSNIAISETQDAATFSPSFANVNHAIHNDMGKTKEYIDRGYSYEVYDPMLSPSEQGDKSIIHLHAVSIKHTQEQDIVTEEKRKGDHDSQNDDYSRVHKVVTLGDFHDPQAHAYANIGKTHSTDKLSIDDAVDGQMINKAPKCTGEISDVTKHFYSRLHQEGSKSVNPYNILKDGKLGQDETNADDVNLTQDSRHLSNDGNCVTRALEEPGSLTNEYAVINKILNSEGQTISTHQQSLDPSDRKHTNMSA